MKKKVLDVTNFKCPMTFLKTKEFIKLNINNKKIIIIKGRKDFELLSNSLKKNFILTPFICHIFVTYVSFI